MPTGTAPVVDAPVRHPWVAAVLVAVGWRLALFAAAFGLPELSPAAFPELGAVLVNLTACLVPLVVIARLGWWREPWLRQLRPRRWWAVLALALLLAVELVFGWEPTPARALGIGALVLAAALSEELYSRGVVQELLRAVPPVGRAVGVGLLFGLGHVLSGVVFGRDLAYLAFQVPHACVVGFAFAALRMQVVSIWPLVALHAWSNFMVLTSPPGAVPEWWEGFKLAAILALGVVVVRQEQAAWRARRLSPGTARPA